jgi:hypothetical protein
MFLSPVVAVAAGGGCAAATAVDPFDRSGAGVATPAGVGSHGRTPLRRSAAAGPGRLVLAVPDRPFIPSASGGNDPDGALASMAP